VKEHRDAGERVHHTELMSTLIALVSAPASAMVENATFEVAWNSQWPSECKHKYPVDSITKWGIRTNKRNEFNGAVVSTLYNRPWAMTLGYWPCVFANGTAVNGGLPQLGNLSRHLAQVRVDAAKLPPNFSGFAVIDWEEWTPWLDPGNALYYNLSLALARGDVDVATKAWNASSLEFMVRTLEVAREVRPLAKWGYFGVIGCTFDVDTEECRPEFQRHNDALQPLWRAQTALYPELYASCPYSGSPAACDASAKLPLKLAARMREARRVVGQLDRPADRLPIIAFTWPALYTPTCASDGHQCPRMENPSDLRAEFELARAAGANGMIVWGAHSDVQHDPSDCDKFARYLETTLGPVLQGEAGRTRLS
jgi:hyaluronoglucosaminidase